MTSNHHDRALARRMEGQLGVATDQHALAVGLTQPQIAHRVRRGTLERPHPGVLRTPGSPRTPESEALAAAWSLGDGATSGPAAAQLWRFVGASRSPVEVTVARGRRATRTFRVHESRWFPPSDRTLLGLVPITTRERTIVDLLRSWTPEAIERALDHELAAHRIRLRRLGATAVPLLGRGHIGSPAMAEMLDARGPGYVPPDSELEARLRSILDTGEWGPVDYQVATPGVGLVDARLRLLPLIVEADGRRWHGRIADFQRDRRRDRNAGASGLHVARFAYEEITESPADIRAVLDAHRDRAIEQGRWAA